MPVMKIRFFPIILLVAFLIAGCRGTLSEEPPVHPVLNMDFQERFEAQEPNDFFDDGRAMRMPVAGTIPRGFLREDAVFNLGRTDAGAFVVGIPIEVTEEVMFRGRDRYDVFCSPCHGYAGDGQGVISTGGYAGMVPAPTYHDDRLRNIEDGYLYDVINNGIRTMSGYGYQIPPEDRWAIVAYVRALQRSQNAGAEDVPAEVMDELTQ
jgi:mono/diheme cytochrome c family protein